MATEDDLKAARSKFDEAFAKASLCSASSQLTQIRVMTLDDLDEAPLHEKIVILDDAAFKFRDIADGRTDPEELPLPLLGRASFKAGVGSRASASGPADPFCLIEAAGPGAEPQLISHVPGDQRP